MTPFGSTRSRIARRHALVAPDGHMEDDVPGWRGARTTVLISPRLAAAPSPGFVQLLVRLREGGGSDAAADGVERFLYVLDGTVRIDADGRRQALTPHRYALLPPDRPQRIVAEGEARLLVFERRYLAIPDLPPPEALFGDARAVPPAPFMGLDGVRAQPLLPNEPAFDLSVTVMRYRPGACLPFVETHEAEHGLLLLAGSGIVRLEDAWYPVRDGDAVWMGPYCPQWFAALGDHEATYLMYKDGRRGPWAGA